MGYGSSESSRPSYAIKNEKTPLTGLKASGILSFARLGVENRICDRNAEFLVFLDFQERQKVITAG